MTEPVLSLDQIVELLGTGHGDRKLHPRTIVRLVYGPDSSYRPKDGYAITFDALAKALGCDKNMLLRVFHSVDVLVNQYEAAWQLQIPERTFRGYKQRGWVVPSVKARGIVRYSTRYLKTLYESHLW